MKHVIQTVCVCLFLSATLLSTAQSNKPHLFAHLPNNIQISTNQLEQLFTKIVGNKTNMPIQAGFSIDGTVIVNQTKFGTLQTVAIKLTQYNNIVFTISKRITANNSVVYTGHLFNRLYADGFELKNNNNNYQLVKLETESILPTCSH
jgi:hypothetical protein